MKRYLKVLIPLIVIVIIILGCFIYFNYFKTTKYEKCNDFVNEVYKKNKDNVNDATKEYMESDYNKSLSKDEQIDNMRCLLEIFEENYVIENLYYDENQKMFTFKDSSGFLNGVMMEEFNSLYN